MVHHDLGELPETALEAWFERWFDVENERREDDETFPADQLHSAAMKPGSVAVDFGTAPAAALLELVSLLEAQGARSVQIDASRDVEPDEDDETIEEVELDDDEGLMALVRRRGPLLN